MTDVMSSEVSSKISDVKTPAPSLMTRVAWIAGLTGLGMCLAVAALIVLNARVAVIQETRSALSSAGASLGTGLRLGGPEEDPLPLLRRMASEFDALRHVSAKATDAGGLVLEAEPALELDEDDDDRPPEWFSALMHHQTQSVEVPALNVAGEVIGHLRLTTDSADEIEEVWEDFRVIIPLISLSALVMVLIAVALCHVFLRRIRVLEAIVSDIRRGDAKARVPDMQAREFTALQEGINDLADFLSRERADNQILQRRILTIGEDERTRIAFDLHDQMGPRLFALTSALEQVRAGSVEASLDPQIRDALDASLHHAKAVQAMARSAINDLRPMVIGHAPLEEALEELIVDFAALVPAPDIRLETGTRSLPDLSEIAELSIYRFVRESVLNALRHGQADRIDIRLSRTTEGPDGLCVSVRDNGSGPPDMPLQLGHGLAGIMDRAAALGATFQPPVREGSFTVTSLRMPC